MGAERPQSALQRGREGRRGGGRRSRERWETATTTTPSLTVIKAIRLRGCCATRKGLTDRGWGPQTGRWMTQASLCSQVPRPPHPFPRGEPENLFARPPRNPRPGTRSFAPPPRLDEWRKRTAFHSPVPSHARSREEQSSRTSDRHDRQSRCSGFCSSPARQQRAGGDCGGGSDGSVSWSRPLDVAGAAAALDKPGWA